MHHYKSTLVLFICYLWPTRMKWVSSKSLSILNFCLFPNRMHRQVILPVSATMSNSRNSRTFRKLGSFHRGARTWGKLSSTKESIVDDATISKTLAQDSEFIKSELDQRQYKCIQLKNNLQCLLVSDPRTDIEAGAMHIKAGHFNDPKHRAGLAHFHEHMVFLGTKRFPKENEFELFLGRNGGSSNAYTDMEDTNYYFNVAPINHDEDEDEDGEDLFSEQEDEFLGIGIEKEYEVNNPNTKTNEDSLLLPLHLDPTTAEIVEEDDEYVEEESVEENGDESKISLALSGALERFSEFFISPLFNPDCVERELRAIDSEYVNGLTQDSWRHYQLLKASANPAHPFGKFGCGNYYTLTNGGNITNSDTRKGSSPRDDLIQFWNQHYVAENMKLCVVGRANIEELQSAVERYFGGVRSQKSEKLKPTVEAFGSDQLGIIRETIPLVEMRSIKLYFATPSFDDPIMRRSKPFNVISHLLGHESPGSLHALLLEEGLINDLSSAVGVETSDFSLCTLSVGLTEKGMASLDYVLDLLWQWINLIKRAVDTNPELMALYHSELRQMASNEFRFRENGDPTDFCSRAAEMLFKYNPSKILIGSAEPIAYNSSMTQQFMEFFTPRNCIVQITSSDFEIIEGSEWKFEPFYRCPHRENKIAEDLMQKWSSHDFNTKMHLPQLNSFIPTDFSLRSDDDDSLATINPNIDYSKTFPSLLVDKPLVRLWHKMDRVFKVPKSAIRIHLSSPNVYKSPRSMSYSRIFQKLLSDDLNSYVYDATMAGSYYRVLCAPYGFSIAITGYSEKLLNLLQVVASRILTLIEDLKGPITPEIERKFEKSRQSLLMETKNIRLDSPYELANYNSRMLIEDHVWHISHYLTEMEGEYANLSPLNAMECGQVVQECFTGRLFADILCMGNCNECEARNVLDIVDKVFLQKCRPLYRDEVTKIVSLKLPNKEEANRIFGIDSYLPFLVYEDCAFSEEEENNAIELVLQCGCEHQLGYKGVALLELIGHMAYNSAYNQLRTKEQLGYIVSSSPRKLSGGALGLSIVIQSSTALPAQLEERCLNWLVLFREELVTMSPDRMKMEATAVVAQLTERNIRFRDEVSFAWGEILSSDGADNKPEFNRLERLADELRLSNSESSPETISTSRRIQNAEQLKDEVLSFWDRYFTLNSTDFRALSARINGSKGKSLYGSSMDKPGFVSSYADVMKLKSFLSSFPSAPYWEFYKADKTLDMNDTVLDREGEHA